MYGCTDVLCLRIRPPGPPIFLLFYRFPFLLFFISSPRSEQRWRRTSRPSFLFLPGTLLSFSFPPCFRVKRVPPPVFLSSSISDNHCFSFFFFSPPWDQAAIQRDKGFASFFPFLYGFQFIPPSLFPGSTALLCAAQMPE